MTLNTIPEISLQDIGEKLDSLQESLASLVIAQESYEIAQRRRESEMDEMRRAFKQYMGSIQMQRQAQRDKEIDEFRQAFAHYMSSIRPPIAHQVGDGMCKSIGNDEIESQTENDDTKSDDSGDGLMVRNEAQADLGVLNIQDVPLLAKKNPNSTARHLFDEMPTRMIIKEIDESTSLQSLAPGSSSLDQINLLAGGFGDVLVMHNEYGGVLCFDPGGELAMTDNKGYKSDSPDPSPNEIEASPQIVKIVLHAPIVDNVAQGVIISLQELIGCSSWEAACIPVNSDFEMAKSTQEMVKVPINKLTIDPEGIAWLLRGESLNLEKIDRELQIPIEMTIAITDQFGVCLSSLDIKQLALHASKISKVESCLFGIIDLLGFQQLVFYPGIIPKVAGSLGSDFIDLEVARGVQSTDNAKGSANSPTPKMIKFTDSGSKRMGDPVMQTWADLLILSTAQGVKTLYGYTLECSTGTLERISIFTSGMKIIHCDLVGIISSVGHVSSRAKGILISVIHVTCLMRVYIGFNFYPIEGFMLTLVNCVGNPVFDPGGDCMLLTIWAATYVYDDKCCIAPKGELLLEGEVGRGYIFVGCGHD